MPKQVPNQPEETLNEQRSAQPDQAEQGQAATFEQPQPVAQPTNVAPSIKQDQKPIKSATLKPGAKVSLAKPVAGLTTTHITIAQEMNLPLKNVQSASVAGHVALEIASATTIDEHELAAEDIIYVSTSASPNSLVLVR